MLGLVVAFLVGLGLGLIIREFTTGAWENPD